MKKESYVTKAGTLVIPMSDNNLTTNQKSDMIDEVCKKHNLNPKKITGVKNWGNMIAVHF